MEECTELYTLVDRKNVCSEKELKIEEPGVRHFLALKQQILRIDSCCRQQGSAAAESKWYNDNDDRDAEASV